MHDPAGNGVREFVDVFENDPATAQCGRRVEGQVSEGQAREAQIGQVSNQSPVVILGQIIPGREIKSNENISIGAVSLRFTQFHCSGSGAEGSPLGLERKGCLRYEGLLYGDSDLNPGPYKNKGDSGGDEMGRADAQLFRKVKLLQQDVN